MSSNLLEQVNNYYTQKLTTHGCTPAGVDWNGAESQTNRFDQLLRICNTHNQFSLNDLGCGYGALYQYMQQKELDFLYAGYDLSQQMIGQAKEKFSSNKNAIFKVNRFCEQEADYTVASGIFNVRLEFSHDEWESYVLDTLSHMNEVSKKGFAFNCLTSYSDKEFMRDYLYYANPLFIFDLCKKKYSKDVALLHDYGLYEFSILIRK